MRATISLGVILATIVIVTGCSKPESTKSDAKGSAVPAAPMPANLFVATAPGGAQNVKDAKATARKGDEIVLVGRIGGSKQAFVEGRAIFTLVDSRVKSCAEGAEMDWCKTPWDYCCEPREELTANLASIEVVGADGKPIKTGLQGANGLKPLAVVTIAGRVADAGGGILLLDAKSIHVGD